MVIVFPAKRKRKPYEEKIIDLQKELQATSRNLGVVYEQHDEVHRQKLILEQELLKINDQINNSKLDLNLLLKLVRQEKDRFDDIVKKQEEIVRSSEMKVKEINNEFESTSIELKKLDPLLKKFEDTKQELSKIEAQLRILRSKEIELEIVIQAKQAENDLEEKRLLKEKSEIEILIKKNARIMSETNQNLHIINIYARRLQRYYDYNGIKFDVLKKFKIESINEKDN